MHKPLAWLAQHRRATIAGAVLAAIGAAALLPGGLNGVHGQNTCGTVNVPCFIVQPTVSPTVPPTTTVTVVTTNPAATVTTVPSTVVTTPPPPPPPPTVSSQPPPPPPTSGPATTPRPATASPAASTVAGAGAGNQQRVVAQAPKAAGAAPVRVALPNTGSGATSHDATDLALPLTLVAIALGGAGAYALKRTED